MPLSLNFKREITFLSAIAGLIGLAICLDRSASPVTVGTLRNPHAGSRNPLDALAYKIPNGAAANLADAGLYGGPTLPLLLSLHPRTRPHYPVILALWLETILLTFAFTSVIKNTANRPRPYMIGTAMDDDRSLSRNDRAAFLSGHAALAAAGSCLFAHLMSVYFPKPPPYQRAAYVLSGLVTGSTAYLRVRAAKHWPTDVLAGVLLGGAVCTFVISAHKNELSVPSPQLATAN